MPASNIRYQSLTAQQLVILETERGRNQFMVKQLLWPDIETLEKAKTARIPALVFSIFSTCLWIAMTIATLLGHKSIYGNLVFLHLTFFVAVSVGLFKMRREASIAYLVVCIVAVIFSWGHTLKLLASMAGIFVSILAIRGMFSYANLSRKPVQQ